MHASKRSLVWTALSLAVAFIYGGVDRALTQDAAGSDEYHAFANKDGVSIEARIVSVSSDWKTMKIRRRDGKEFEMPVNVLTLDDQQFVKSWIKLNPNSAAVEYQLDVAFAKKEDTTVRKRGEYYRFSAKDVTYQVSIRNKTSETLVGAMVEYVVLVDEQIQIMRDASGGPESYDRRSDGEANVRLVKGTEKLPDSLAYNYTHGFLTQVATVERVQGDGNYTYGEDSVIGMLARVTDRDGKEIGVYRSGETKMRNVTWESVMGKTTNTASSSQESSSTSSATPTPSTSSSNSSVAEGVDVRQLDEWPATLQKGDTLRSGAIPDLAGKPVYITATIDLDENNPDGVILAHGGGQKGYAIFVQDGKLRFWVKKGSFNGNIVRSVEISLAGLPTRDFELKAEYSSERLQLQVNGQVRKTADSFDYFSSAPQEGLSIGYDSGTSSVGPAAANKPFPGLVQDVKIKFGL